MQSFKQFSQSLLLLSVLISVNVMAEDNMLTDQPYFTYQIEAKDLRYEAKINGVMIHRDLDGRQIVTE